MTTELQYYDHSTIADKYYFGGFFNLADDNKDAVLAAYKTRFGIKKEIEEEVINQLSDEKLLDVDFERRVDFLSRHLPFVGYLDRKDRKKFAKQLEKLFSAIETLRNFYTHHYHPKILFDDIFYATLDELFLQTVKNVREKLKQDEAMTFWLNTARKEELNGLCKAEEESLAALKKKNSNISLDKESIRNRALNRIFKPFIGKNKNTGTESLKDKYRSKPNNLNDDKNENGTPLKRRGLIFLLCLFLNPDDGAKLRAHIEGFKGTAELKEMATHWVFSELAFRETKEQVRTSSTPDKETLLIQIADELSKAPDAVYKTLSDEQKADFVEDINEYIKDGNETLSLEESIVSHPIIRKRYEDKFPYFALRYLDEFVEFPNLRFQIKLGNYVHDRREKQVGGTTLYTDRVVKEPIRVFARLSEATKLKGALNEKLKRGEPESGWELYPNPLYDIEQGNVMIYLKVDDKKTQSYKTHRDTEEKRELRRDGKATKNTIINEITKNNEMICAEPVAQFSLQELPALLYALLGQKKEPKWIEAQLHKRIGQRIKALETYQADAYPRETPGRSQFPAKLLKSAENETKYDTKKLTKAIEAELDISEQKSAWLKTLNGKKKAEANKERGREAVWLARDLVRLMPKENRAAWKGYMHSQLQYLLAFGRIDEAYKMIADVWDFDNRDYWWNIPLKNTFRQRTFDDFFAAYLNLRDEIYESLTDHSRDLHDRNKALWNLFPERTFRIDTTQNQKNRLLAKPIVLGRGIFDDKPTFIKGVKIGEDPDKFAEWYRQAREYPKQKYQRFYDYGRDYAELFKEAQTKILTHGEERKKSLEKLKIEHDLYIKRLMTEDWCLKLIFDDLYERIFAHRPDDISLSDFYLTRAERQQQIRIADTQHRREKGDRSDNIVKESFIWDKTITGTSKDENGKIRIKEPNIKLKDVGKIKRLANDRRIKECILKYDPTREWTRGALEKELTSYETVRIRVLKKVQLLETQILRDRGFDGTNHPQAFEQKDKTTGLPNGIPEFRQYIFQGLLKGEGTETDKEWAEMLVLIRNKFAHNELLLPDKLKNMLELCGEQHKADETYSETIGRCLETIIGKFLQAQ